jgi:hypothetical protein
LKNANHKVPRVALRQAKTASAPREPPRWPGRQPSRWTFR